MNTSENEKTSSREILDEDSLRRSRRPRQEILEEEIQKNPEGATFENASRTADPENGRKQNPGGEIWTQDSWKELMALPTIGDRVEALRNPITREKLIKDGIADGSLKDIAHMLHPFGTENKPNVDFERQQNLQQLADAAGKDVVETYVERLLESEGKEFFNFWMFGGNLENQWNYMRLPQVVPMLGDAGAHVGFLRTPTLRQSCSASSPANRESILCPRRCTESLESPLRFSV